MAYTPATNLTTTATVAHGAAVFYKKTGLDILQKKFKFGMAAMSDVVPKQSGRTVQWFRYANLAASSTAATEGTVGTGLALTSHILTATVSQYADFISVSDLLEDTLIDPVVQNASERLGYRAGLSVDTMTKNVLDAENTGMAQTVLSTYLRVADLRNARHQLQAVDVEPSESDGTFLAIAHPFATYDVVNDPAAGGLADIVKYTGPKDSALVKYEDRGMIATVGGCKLIESTNISAVSTDEYRTYIFGKNAFGTVDLEGRGPSKVTDPKSQRFAIRVIRDRGDNIANPEGLIRAAVSYNFVFTAVVLEGPTGIGGTYRGKQITAHSTVG